MYIVTIVNRSLNSLDEVGPFLTREEADEWIHAQHRTAADVYTVMHKGPIPETDL